MVENKRFTLGKDYDSDGNWEYCYQDNETGIIFNFADEFCDTNFLELVNAVITTLRKENKELRQGIINYTDEIHYLTDKSTKLEKQNKELKYHLNRVEKELKEYKDFMSLG